MTQVKNKSNRASLNFMYCLTRYKKKNTTSLPWYFSQRYTTWIQSWGNIRQTWIGRYRLQNNGQGHEGQEKTESLLQIAGKSKEAWQLKVAHDSELISFAIKNTIEALAKTWGFSGCNAAKFISWLRWLFGNCSYVGEYPPVYEMYMYIWCWEAGGGGHHVSIGLCLTGSGKRKLLELYLQLLSKFEIFFKWKKNHIKKYVMVGRSR